MPRGVVSVLPRKGPGLLPHPQSSGARVLNRDVAETGHEIAALNSCTATTDGSHPSSLSEACQVLLVGIDGPILAR